MPDFRNVNRRRRKLERILLWMAALFRLVIGRRGRMDMRERLLNLRNDVGLLSEEYDPQAKRLVGNFPQAFSHITLVNTAHNLTRDSGPSKQRASSWRAWEGQSRRARVDRRTPAVESGQPFGRTLPREASNP